MPKETTMPKRKSKSKDEKSTEKSTETETETHAVGEFYSSTDDAFEPMADEPVAEVKPEPAASPASAPENKPEPSLHKIPLKVFEKLAGARWDQLAGFKLWAKKQGLGSMTVPKWREALQTYRTKPTK
jgi:hypothetical protein